MSGLLNKSDMAASIGISVQAFDKWGVTPVEKRGREVFYDVKSVLEMDRERRRKNSDPDDDEDLEKQLLLARIKLTEEQGMGQQLKNKQSEGTLINTGFCAFALSRLAMDLSSTLDSIPLSMQRQFPDLSPRQADHLKTLIAKAANQCAAAGKKIPGWIDDYIRTADE